MVSCSLGEYGILATEPTFGEDPAITILTSLNIVGATNHNVLTLLTKTMHAQMIKLIADWPSSSPSYRASHYLYPYLGKDKQHHRDKPTLEILDHLNHLKTFHP